MKRLISSVLFSSLVFLSPVTSLVARAIPINEAIQKLSVIVVYVLAKGPDEFLLMKKDNITIVPLYLSEESAIKAASERSVVLGPGGNAQIIPYTLDRMYSVIEAAESEYKSRSEQIVFPIYTRKNNDKKAREILKAEGLSDEKISKDLRFPVFYSDPMINLKASDGKNRQVFFVDYSKLSEALKMLPAEFDKPVIKVSNLDSVISMIANSKEDIYAIHPTPEYIRLRNKYGSRN